MKREVVMGTRGSALALAQAEQVKALMTEMFTDVTVTIRSVKTEGDQDVDTPLAEFGGRGAFVTSLEQSLRDGSVDVAVHSLKDLPSRIPSEFVLGAVPFREDPRDVIVTQNGVSFDMLPDGAVVGTGSIRRRIQLQAMRSGLTFADIRGNIDTRLEKLKKGEYDAIVLAAAGLIRLGRKDVITGYFDVEKIIPAPCQGAIGIECRADRTDLLHALKNIDKPDIRLCVDAERAFIATLGMGCHAPVAAFALIGGGGTYFRAMAGTESGRCIQRTIQSSRGALVKAVHNLAIEFRMKLNKMK